MGLLKKVTQSLSIKKYKKVIAFRVFLDPEYRSASRRTRFQDDKVRKFW